MSFPILNIAILIICLAILIVLLIRKNKATDSPLEHKINSLENQLTRLESHLKTDLKSSRDEAYAIAKDNRAELFNALREAANQQQQALRELNKTLEEKISTFNESLHRNHLSNRQELAKQIADFSCSNTAVLEKFSTQAGDNNQKLQQALTNAFKEFHLTLDKSVKTFNDFQRERFSQMENRQHELVRITETKLESIRATVEEKLEKTLSERLGQSFDTVGKHLIEVQRGLGEMQAIASDVGGLKKVLSNVKLRGGVGEVQLAMLLEQILAPTQYDANVRTKKGSADAVEFAIKLPGKSEDEHEFVYLPVDAKFPKDAYEHLVTAYENAIPEDIEAAIKNLEATIRRMAKDIRDKYIDPPNTTDFAIMFLPFESIYAEVIRRSALIDELRSQYNITVAGPTTLMAILNSLQMGFRTLALQKRSSEVWKILGEVKNEFANFGGLLEKAQKNIQTGLGQLDDVMGTRTRALQRKLRNVESLPAADGNVLPENDLMKGIAEE